MADREQAPASTRRDRIRALVPWAGAALLVGLFAATTNWPKMWAAMQQAQLLPFVLALSAISAVVWVYDSLCLLWLVRRTLGDQGQTGADRLRELLPLKAASYLINMLNYHAAALGMAFLLARRKQVPFLQAAGALALLSMMDILTVTAMSMVGVWLAPEFFGPHPELQVFLKVVAVIVFTGALASVLVLQSDIDVAMLRKLRAWAPLRPLAALKPLRMLEGVALRAGLLGLYTFSVWWLVQFFGMVPDFGRLCVAMPIVTVVGTLPISVSGVGSTQVLMRSFYAPFVQDGRDPAAVVDAFSTLYIFCGAIVRLVIAAPFFRAIAAELKQRPNA
ncbi:MAG: flippase-like domain-containing protein [Deltaproteobacteria bacterium]|nr:flippase-like domain-containing protein [Deltaproteobacteria bacterium]